MKKRADRPRYMIMEFNPTVWGHLPGIELALRLRSRGLTDDHVSRLKDAFLGQTPVAITIMPKPKPEPKRARKGPGVTP